MDKRKKADICWAKAAVRQMLVRVLLAASQDFALMAKVAARS